MVKQESADPGDPTEFLEPISLSRSACLEKARPKKLEISRVVEESKLSVRRTIEKPGVSRSKFYRR